WASSMNFHVSSALLGCVLISPLMAAPEAVSIAFKPTPAAVQYWVRSGELESRHGLAERPKWRAVQGLGLVQQAVQQSPGGQLSVAVSSQARTLAIDHKVVQTGEEQKPET